MTLFKSGAFKLHSGKESNWIIDCASLSDEDIETLALLGSKIVPSFGRVIGIPRGGLRLARAMEAYKTNSLVTLVVDDVFTTGTSMREARAHITTPCFGLVIFARSETPIWVSAIFRCMVAE